MSLSRATGIISLLLLTACSGAKPPVEFIQANIHETSFVARWDKYSEAKRWTAEISEAIDKYGTELLSYIPPDIDEFCPGYTGASKTQRKAFWIGLFSALTRWESNFNPSVSYREPKILDKNGQRVISRGLLQISIESGRGYGCIISDEDSLHNTQVNLSCGIRIANRLVIRDKSLASNQTPWKGMSAYWSPFRDVNKRKDIADWTKQQAYCKKNI